ncbi:MAG: protein-(glutamine-N5) methyltransferase, release factor-specific, partial [Prochlorococcus sp.]|nr:protein-(glutamine-N5) methyltransferase, release factor-specific [Prochlorococcus sp.]
DQSDAVLILMRDQGLTDVAFKFDLQGVRRFALGRHPVSLPLRG